MGDGGFSGSGFNFEESFEGRIQPEKLKSDEDVVKEINENNAFRDSYNGTKTQKEHADENTVYWKAMRIRLKGDQLVKAGAAIKKIKSIIKKIKKLVNTVRQFSKLLERLEEIITSPIIAIIEMIQENLRKALREIGSTGVYVLSTHEYTNTTQSLLSEEIEIMEKPTIERLLGSKSNIATNLFNIFKEENTFLKNQTSETNARRSEVIKLTGDLDAANISNLRYSYYTEENGVIKKHTINFGDHIPLLYNEFIEIIAESFIDQNDRPDGDFMNEYLVQRDPKPENGQPLTVEEWLASSWTDKILNKNRESGSSFYRAGRPVANEGTKMQVMIIAMALPSYDLFVANIGTLAVFFGSFIEDIWNGMTKTVPNLFSFAKEWKLEAYDNNIRNLESESNIVSKNLNGISKLIKTIEEEISKTPKNAEQRLKDLNEQLETQQENRFNIADKYNEIQEKLVDLKEKRAKFQNDESVDDPKNYSFLATSANKAQTWIGETVDDYNEVTALYDSDTNTERIADLATERKRARFVVEGGDPPDFYGVSVSSLFRPFFILLENLIGKLEGLKKAETGLARQLNKILSDIEKKLRELEAVAELLEKIIQQIEALLAMNISILKVSSTKGNFDIYEKIINSRGFPSETVQTPMYHYGFAMVYVEPDLANSETLRQADASNLSRFFKNKQAEFDAESGEILAEAKDSIGVIENILGIQNPKISMEGGMGSTNTGGQ
jgi:hypothetical protein